VGYGARLRVSVGRHLNQRLQGGSTALMWAVLAGHVDCVRLLLGAGADKEAKDKVCVTRSLRLLFLLKTIYSFSDLFCVLQISCFANLLLILYFYSMHVTFVACLNIGNLADAHCGCHGHLISIKAAGGIGVFKFALVKVYVYTRRMETRR
jgi:hypothetical protein